MEKRTGEYVRRIMTVNEKYRNTHMLSVDPSDSILQCWIKGTDGEYLDENDTLAQVPSHVPVAIRGMTNRKLIAKCEEQGRDYYYVDTGYTGNLTKRKNFHRVVKNGMQHNQMKDVPVDRLIELVKQAPYFVFGGWKKQGSAILLVTPSEKPCKFYGISRDDWVSNTINELKKHTDRPIIIRDKVERRLRVGTKNIYKQFDDDDIFATVTYNSIAALESVAYGIPAFTGAPTAADPVCLKDISRIENPYYPNADKVYFWQKWLAYCQYSTKELVDGSAWKIIKEHNL